MEKEELCGFASDAGDEELGDSAVNSKLSATAPATEFTGMSVAVSSATTSATEFTTAFATASTTASYIIYYNLHYY